MNKRVVIVSLLSLLIVFTWWFVNLKLQQLHPEWYQPAKPEQTAGQNDKPAEPVTQPATQVSVAPAPTTQSGVLRPIGGDGKTAQIGSSKIDGKRNGEFAMGVAL